MSEEDKSQSIYCVKCKEFHHFQDFLKVSLGRKVVGMHDSCYRHRKGKETYEARMKKVQDKFGDEMFSEECIQEMEIRLNPKKVEKKSLDDYKQGNQNAKKKVEDLDRHRDQFRKEKRYNEATPALEENNDKEPKPENEESRSEGDHDEDLESDEDYEYTKMKPHHKMMVDSLRDIKDNISKMNERKANKSRSAESNETARPPSQTQEEPVKVNFRDRMRSSKLYGVYADLL